MLSGHISGSNKLADTTPLYLSGREHFEGHEDIVGADAAHGSARLEDLLHTVLVDVHQEDAALVYLAITVQSSARYTTHRHTHGKLHPSFSTHCSGKTLNDFIV